MVNMSVTTDNIVTKTAGMFTPVCPIHRLSISVATPNVIPTQCAPSQGVYITSAPKVKQAIKNAPVATGRKTSYANQPNNVTYGERPRDVFSRRIYALPRGRLVKTVYAGQQTAQRANAAPMGLASAPLQKALQWEMFRWDYVKVTNGQMPIVYAEGKRVLWVNIAILKQ